MSSKTTNERKLEYVYDNVQDILFNASETSVMYNTGIYFMDGEGRVVFQTYHKIYHKAKELVHGLLKEGLLPGDKVILQLERQEDVIEGLWACLIGGFIPVLVNTVNFYSGDSEEFNRLLNVCKQLPEATILSTEQIWNRITKLSNQVHKKCIYLEKISQGILGDTSLDKKTKDSTGAILLYSSGSTGLPKGIMLTQKNICVSLAQTCEFSNLTRADVAVNWLPLSHVAGLVVMHLASTLACCNQFLMPTNVFIEDSQLYMDILAKYHGTITMLPNFALNHLIRQKETLDVSKCDLSNLRMIWNGTEPVYYETIQKFETAFSNCYLNPNVMHTFYGMTEACCMITMQESMKQVRAFRTEKQAYHSGKIVRASETDTSFVLLPSSGVAIPGISIKIVDTNGTIVNEEEIGEIRIRGDNIIQNYYGDCSTMCIDEEGFFITGDTGFLSDGHLYIIGRQKHMVILNGQNYYAEDIERICESNPRGCKCIACGIHNMEEQKEELVIFVETPKHGEFEEIMSYIRASVSKAFGQRVNHVIPVEQLSYTASGKKQRNKMKEEFKEGRYEKVPTIKLKVASIKPTGTMVEQLQWIWQEELQIEGIECEEDFYSLGGDSLTMLKIIARIKKQYQVFLSPLKFSQLGTISKLSMYIEQDGSKSKKKESEDVELPTIQEDGGKFPLTLVQSAYFTGRKKEFLLGGMSTHICYQIETKFDIKRLNEALNELIQVQPMLRAVITEDGTQHIVSQVPSYVIEAEDVSNEDKVSQAHKLNQQFNSMSTNVFELGKWPMFEVKAIKVAKNTSHVFFNFDLLIMDGGSIHIFMRQLFELYHKKTEICVSASFRSYSEYLNRLKNTSMYVESKKYWMKQIEEFPHAPLLPLKKEISQVNSLECERMYTIMEHGKWERFKKEAASHGVSPSIVLLTMYAEVLRVWSGQDRMALNVTVFNRPAEYRALSQTIGDFTSILLLGIDFTGKMEFWQKASHIREKLLEAMTNRYYDGIEVIRELSKKEDNQLLMPVVFTSMLFTDDIAGTVDELGTVVDGMSQTSQVYLDFQIIKMKQGILFSWDYVKELFEKDMIAQMFQAYTDGITQIAETGSMKPIRISQEDASLIRRYNDTVYELTITTIPKAFVQSAKQHSGHVAVKDGTNSITYGKLDYKSNQLAAYLKEKGVHRSDVVAVMGERTIATIINILGILKAGAAYVAIDPEYPKERIEYICNTSESVLLLKGDTFEREQIECYSGEEIDIDSKPQDKAYIIYTSGSTGRPKGVVVSHAAAMNTILDINLKYHVGVEDTILGLSSMSFDLSVYDIFGSLLSGATLVQIPEVRDIKNIIQVLETESITIWNSVPAIMDMLMENIEVSSSKVSYWEMDSEAEISLDNETTYALRLALLSGDWIPLALPNKIRSVFHQAEVISLGGATEAAIWSIYYPIKQMKKEWNSIPYGYPLANQQVYVLDSNKEIAPIGVVGELYIGGMGVADGYQGDSEKTNKAFVNHSVLGRLYRTGDFGVFQKEGYIEFLGRKDQQVKISGHRIELGEIEHILVQYKDIQNAVVVVKQDERKKNYLCGYYIAETNLQEDAIQQHMEASLPDYMVPQYFIRMKEIPLTSNGKVDIKALPNPQKGTKEEYVAPLTKTERKLAKLWEEVLQITNISTNESFLKLGGDSIMMVRTIAKIAETMHVDVTFREFMRANTIKKLSDLLDSKEENVVERYKKWEGDVGHRYDKFPLTNVQMAYLMGRNTEYHLGGVSTHAYYEIETQHSLNQLNQSLNQLICQQDMLRAIVKNDGTQQILETVPDYVIEAEDMVQVSKQEQEARIQKMRERMSHAIFDTQTWPLFEVKAIRVSKERYRLFIGFDLLIMDGASLEIFVHQWLEFYKDRRSVLKPSFSFRDYVIALEQFKTSDIYKKDEEYWLEKVEDFPNAPALPLKRNQETIQKPHFRRCQKQMDGTTWDKLQQLAREHNVTPSVLLCTMYAKVLSYWSNQKRLGLNVTVFTRYPFHDAVSDMIGDFTSVMLLDVEVDYWEDVWKSADKVRNVMMEAFEHRHYDGIEFLRNISREREDGAQVVMPIVFTSMLSSDRARGKLSDLGKLKHSVSQTSQVYLDYQVMEMEEGILITWDYMEELFEKEVIESMFHQYLQLLDEAIHGQRVEKSIYKSTKRMYERYNNTKKDYKEKTIQQALLEAVTTYRHQIAIKCNSYEMKYEELDKKSNQVASYLIQSGITKQDVVGVLAERVPETVVNIIGILKAGASYVAIDPEYPSERKTYILNHSNCKCCLTPEVYREERLETYSDGMPDVSYHPQDVAYTIYTSGSTGQPKGVVITHEAVMNTLLDINERFWVTPRDRVIGLSSLCFDLSVYDVFGTLIAGATLVQVPDIRDAKNLLNIVKREKITIWNSVPAIMDMVLENAKLLEKEEVSFWDMEGETAISLEESEEINLRLVLLSGDWIPLQLPDKIKMFSSKAKVISLGGATEASIWSIYYPIEGMKTEWNSIPYGYPLSNQSFYILNYANELCPKDVPGELFIGGKGVALEYKNDKEKTDAAFINHSQLGRIYRTGDYGVMRNEGYIEFLGRRDQQVKISGHRIELGEIENCLIKQEQIQTAVVVDREDTVGHKYLCAYIVSNAELSEETIQNHVASFLPDYMVPRYVIQMDAIPLTGNGKVNKKALPKPEIQLNAKKLIAPSNELEETLAKIWKEVLGMDQISMDDSFLRLGGDSILMVRVITKIGELLSIEITFKEFMKSNTIEKLAKLLEGRAKTNQQTKYKTWIPDRVHAYEKFPLTDVQMAYLMGRNSEFALGGISTHGYYEIETRLDLNRFRESLNQVIRNQPMLRAIVLKSGEQQILEEVPEYRIHTKDLRSLTQEEQDVMIQEERKRMSHHVFDTEQWPLFEFKAYQLSDEISYLFFGIDLLIADGSSMRILIKSLMDSYNEENIRQIGEFSFRDYIVAFEDFKMGEVYQNDKNYWMEQLEEFPMAPSLPLKNKIEAVTSPHFERCQTNMSKKEWEKIKAIANQKGITPSVLLCTLYSLVLGFWSNQKHHALNITVFTRYPFALNVDQMIGDFTSVILLDVKLQEGNDIWACASKIQETLLEGFEHRHYDGINFIREIKKKHNLHQQAIMPIVFTSMLFTMEGDETNASFHDLGEIKMGVSQTSQVYLDYQVMETNDGLSITWDYVEELFEKDMIEQMFLQYISLLKGILEQKCDCNLTVADRTLQLIKEYNQTAVELPITTIQEAFAQTVKKHPNKIAVKDCESSITFSELDKKSNQVAAFLREQGFGKNQVIAILAERRKETVVYILGVLKSGNAYVAIDPQYPEHRKNYIKDHSGSVFCFLPDSYETLGLKGYSQEEIGQIGNLDDVAYIIYTSGSTGRPKGVVITQEAVMNTILDINQRFDVNSNDVIIALSSMCFDLSVYDLFGSFVSGATLLQITEIHDINYIRNIIKQENVTIWNSVPAIMDMVLQARDVSCESLRLVLLSGDWIPLQLPEKIRTAFLNSNVISLGGATEASIWSIYYPISEVKEEWNSIPYGYPLANQGFYVLNYQKQLCPLHVEGELYISGKGLALEYKNDEDKTKEAFIQHPELGRLYRTGDYGVLREQGYIEFLGRKDHQIKISGHRIELGEIENCLVQYPEITNAVVVDKTTEQGQKYLCAYYIARTQISEQLLTSFMEQTLPEYMVPRYYVHMEKIPLTSNGKVNRKMLPNPKRNEQKKEIISPRNKIETCLFDIWSEVLNVEEISVTDSFLQIGGDSIRMVSVVTKVMDIFRVDVTFQEFMVAKNIENLAVLIQEKGNKDTSKRYKEYVMDKEHMHDLFELTEVQMAYFIGRNDEISLGGISTHGYYEVETELDVKRLNDSLNEVIKIQPMLRAIVKENGKQQILPYTEPYHIVEEDIRKFTKEEQSKKIVEERERMSHHIFKTDQWPLFEIKSYKHDHKNYLFLSIDLLIMDGTSMGIFIRQWLEAYYGILEVKEPNFTFRDYVMALGELQGTKVYALDKEYWQKKVKEFPMAPSLPLKRAAKEIVHPHFQRKHKLINAGRWKQLKRVAGKKNVTPSVVLGALYAKVLGYWSNQQRLGLNVTIFNRHPFHSDVQDMIGDFTSVILLDILQERKESFWEFAQKVQATLMEALEHRHYDGVKVIREIAKHREDNQQAIMPIVFTSMLSTDEKLGSISDLGKVMTGISQTSQVYLDYQAMETNDGLSVTWDYVDEIFDEQVINQMFLQYIGLLDALMLTGDIDKLHMCKQMQEQWIQYNATKANFEATTIPEKFMEIAKQYPDQIAVKNKANKITYKELDIKSNQIASYLIGEGIEKNQVVGVLGERTIETIINVMGIMKAGAAYVAIDPEYPMERREYILTHSKSSILLDSKSYEENQMQSFCGQAPDIRYDGASIAYIIYTSGSTGTPKGVMVTQASVMNTLIDVNQRFSVTYKDKVIGLSSMSFDLSVFDIFGAFICGATLVQIPEVRDVKNISQTVKQEGVTIWNSVPAIMDMVLESVEVTEHTDSEFWDMEHETEIKMESEEHSSLRLVMLSGDWIPLGLPDKIRSSYPEAEVISLGGATEAAIWSIYYPIGQVQSDWKSIPYGVPLSNQSFYVLDYEGTLCPTGVAGELYIGGMGVAIGYQNDSKRTDESFVKHSEYGRLYRTGDYGRLKKEGYIEFLGRKDFQVKINGHRIELGEIEHSLMQYPSIKNAIVIDQTDTNLKKYLVAYYTSEEELDEQELIQHLKKKLPDYMVPNYVMHIPTIPLTSNGKVDRTSLPKPNVVTDEIRLVEPQNEMEKDILDIWKEVLSMNEISTHDNFFRLGGDSVGAIKVYSMLSKQYKLSVNDIFKNQTIVSLAQVLEAQNRMQRNQTMKKEYLDNINQIHEIEHLEKDRIEAYRKRYKKELVDWYPQDDKEWSDVLLTGATGYLGAYMLKTWIEQTKAQLYVLVRGTNNKGAMKRLNKQLSFYFGDDFYETNKARIHVLCGDLTQHHFALEEKEYRNISSKIKDIINCAANVSHFGMYEDLYEVNVKGVKNLLQFAQDGSQKAVYHMSTTTIASGAIKGKRHTIFSEYELEVNQEIENVYVKTKMEAETLLLDARKQGIQTTIFRIGNISFQSDCGSFQKNMDKNAFYNLVRSYLALGLIPKSDFRCMEISYVDYVSESIYLLMSKGRENETYHIQNSKMISFDEFTEMLNEIKIPMKKVSYLDFMDALEQLRKDPRYLEHVDTIRNHSYLLPWHSKTVFKVLSEKTDAILHKLGFDWKKPNTDSLFHMIAYGKSKGFFTS